MGKLLDEIGVLFAHVFGIATEHAHCAVFKLVDLGSWIYNLALSGESIITAHLSPLSVVLVLARKLFVLETVQDFTDSFGRLCQHGLQWYARRQLALVLQPINAST